MNKQIKTSKERLNEIASFLHHVTYMNTTNICDQQNRALKVAIQSLTHIQNNRNKCSSGCLCSCEADFAQQRIQAILNEESQ